MCELPRYASRTLRGTIHPCQQPVEAPPTQGRTASGLSLPSVPPQVAMNREFIAQ